MIFHFLKTEDGSPSVRLDPSGGVDGTLSEAMHSLKGAFSETVYIYGQAMDLALTSGFRPRVLSLGLGLGYNEILAVAKGLEHGRAADPDFGGESFEIVPELRDYFRAWALEEKAPAEFTQVYDEILERSSALTARSPQMIRSCLADVLRSGQWLLREDLNAGTQFQQSFGCICFDAFSSKTSPDLWTEEFLTSFLKRAAAADCVLSTYACTGALKRGLRSTGFELNIREGFASKRDSTFAMKRSSQNEI